ncbi:MAG: hypothetical protein K2N41_05595 [Lachnospiraceae bacterium]|nr:hypothetical protein [Lachnospiraceae bacterium]MDE7239170.1 hypothetical protein [Lachnospiraceae bacterium]
MKKELPINLKPFIRVIPQYAFLEAMINNDRTNIDMLCSLDIVGLRPNEWNFEIQDAEVRIENETVNLYRKGFGLKPPGRWYHHIENGDETIFHIRYQQYSNRWDSIIFYINTCDQIMSPDSTDWNYRFSIHCCGDLRIDVNENMVFFENNWEDEEAAGWYKIKVDHDKIRVYSSFDGQAWTLFHEIELEGFFSKRKYVSGFQIRLFDNQYYKWLCNNFIQIRYDKDSTNAIGYPGFLSRDWRSYVMHPLVRFSQDKRETVLRWGLWNYIVNNIDSKRYLEIWLDEFYIEGTEAFQKQSFSHENLIYGYNDECNTVYILCIFHGKLKPVEIPVETVTIAWEKAVGRNAVIKAFEYSPDQMGIYRLDVDHICKHMKDYLSGRNSSLDYQYLSQEEPGAFGLAVYESILNNSESKGIFLYDYRVAYLIKEHKECMLFRIEYLHDCGVIQEKDYPYLKERMDEIVKIANIIMNLVIKNRMAESESVQNRIWNYIQNLREYEEKCYTYLIQVLETYLSQSVQ